MSAAYLIDGYNLLHGLGILQRRVGPRGLEKARQRLLGFLSSAHSDDPGAVTVVFDAAAAPPGVSPTMDFQGLHVCFAVGHDQADDLIELLIRRASVPRQLHVISDDHRLQRAGRRRQCQVMGCADYLEWLDRRQRQRPVARQAPEKGQEASEAETRHWLAEFADLADDPDLKELFDPFGFQAAPGESTPGTSGDKTSPPQAK
jgi:predicted RNA-binding protein with PIN domain